eukprot:162649-Amphidinium_carterae.1
MGLVIIRAIVIQQQLKPNQSERSYAPSPVTNRHFSLFLKLSCKYPVPMLVQLVLELVRGCSWYTGCQLEVEA